MATAAEVRDLLGATTLPPSLVDELLDEVSFTWLLGEPAELLATDLALCHPPLAEDEVRAQSVPTDAPGVWRLGLLAHDRPGLLAVVTGVLAAEGRDVVSASATTFAGRGVALMRLHVRDVDSGQWELLGQRLRAALAGSASPGVALAFRPAAPAVVEAMPQAGGRVLVSLEAPDQVGLLSFVARWFEEHGANIEAVTATSEDGRARDTFLVEGAVDAAALATALSGRGTISSLPPPVVWATRAAVAGVGVGLAALRWLRRRP